MNIDKSKCTPEAAAEARAKLSAKSAERVAKVEELSNLGDVLEAQCLEEFGALGVSCAVVRLEDLLEEPVAIKLGETVVHKRFAASKMTDVDVFDYVSPSIVYPSKEAFSELCHRRGAVAGRVGTALAALHGVKMGDDAKK